MYPRNAASPERIAVGAVVQISDGAVQTSGISVSVLGQGGSTGAGGGTPGNENGIYTYIPTQAETNYTSFIVTAYKIGCIPASVTVVTTASVTPGTVLLAPVTHTSAVVPTVTTVTNQLTAAAIATGVWTDTTASDFTTSLSIGKSVMNGVTLGTGLTVNALTGAVTLANGAHGGAAATLALGGAGGLTGNITGTLSTGNWNVGKTGYSLSQTFPTNFADLAITASTGRVTVGTNADKTGYALTTADWAKAGDAMTLTAAYDGAKTAMQAGAEVSANVKKINSVTITGDGSGTPFTV